MTHALRPTPRQPRADAPRSALRLVLSILLAAAVIAASAAAGFFVVDLGSQRPIVSGDPSPTATAAPPVADVKGHDLRHLDRYPGSVRTAYLHERQGSTAVTAISYLAAAPLDDVRGFYRRLFREHGWELIELDFSGGDWTFLVEKGRRAALIGIEQRGSHVVVEIEHERPVSAASPRRTPAPPPPPRPPPGDDDDDDD